MQNLNIPLQFPCVITGASAGVQNSLWAVKMILCIFKTTLASFEIKNDSRYKRQNMIVSFKYIINVSP